MSAEREVLEAAGALVDDFGAGRVEDYFARLAPDATFVFHTAPARLESRDAYRALWDTWVADDGFRVVSCASSGGLVQMLADDVAVFSHDVATTVGTNAGEESLHERETIVFARRDSRWLVVHEHLSAVG
jgi:ketosteroid isomerase-like protein